ncbi:leucine zipper domain-containing protein, partial [Corynebacterium sp.]|uniref:leucine zipper domain-containing protein n=1 Tax=Corynebacterium sp. TaxID=1720 RepID=UPI0026DA7283
MTHANAPLTPTGRLRLASLIVDDGWTIARAAERFQVSAATAWKWSRRYRAGLPMTDRPSRPATSPNQTPRRTEHRIIGLRHTRRWG